MTISAFVQRRLLNNMHITRQQITFYVIDVGFHMTRHFTYYQTSNGII